MGVNQSTEQGAGGNSPPTSRRSSSGSAGRSSDGAGSADGTPTSRRPWKAPYASASRGEATHFSSLSHEKMAELIKKEQGLSPDTTRPTPAMEAFCEEGEEEGEEAQQ
eukprot:CAMPEP_0181326612 /NCGR_PEP_ID=MMETSP1101-20121128/21606_1 /TAXON_ID=46948 /ORGANISM="Rhodomonas abbreviata, Strain Caron Lab Isolate" /LENGTH=107 /DNA_ID=CAMNT_0023435107 /DNA_START=79 /DNA_END=399 /DNA_ORIENTATION=+